jgi:hypothetical protein
MTCTPITADVKFSELVGNKLLSSSSTLSEWLEKRSDGLPLGKFFMSDEVLQFLLENLDSKLIHHCSAWKRWLLTQLLENFYHIMSRLQPRDQKRRKGNGGWS